MSNKLKYKDGYSFEQSGEQMVRAYSNEVMRIVTISSPQLDQAFQFRITEPDLCIVEKIVAGFNRNGIEVRMQK